MWASSSAGIPILSLGWVWCLCIYLTLLLLWSDDVIIICLCTCHSTCLWAPRQRALCFIPAFNTVPGTQECKIDIYWMNERILPRKILIEKEIVELKFKGWVLPHRGAGEVHHYLRRAFLGKWGKHQRKRAQQGCALSWRRASVWATRSSGTWPTHRVGPLYWSVNDWRLPLGWGGVVGVRGHNLLGQVTAMEPRPTISYH